MDILSRVSLLVLVPISTRGENKGETKSEEISKRDLSKKNKRVEFFFFKGVFLTIGQKCSMLNVCDDLFKSRKH